MQSVTNAKSSAKGSAKNASKGRIRSISGPGYSGVPKGQGQNSAPAPSNPYKR